MAKNTPQTPTQPENETEALAQNPTSPEQAQQETLQPQDAANAALQAEITALREANAALTAERDAAQAALLAAQAALLAAQQAAAQATATQPENPDADPRQAILACSADGVEFWRGGVLFNHEWQRIERAEVGDEAWQRIVNEPRLRIKAADEYGA